jgi:hypothetical protein
MLKTVSNALLALVLDKGARDRLRRRRQADAETERARHIKEAEDAIAGVMTPERRELIRQALAVHQAKSKIIEDLEDDDKRRLYALAVKRLLDEDEGDGGDGGPRSGGDPGAGSR